MPRRLFALSFLVTAGLFLLMALLPSASATTSQHSFNAAGVMGLLAAATLIPLRPRGGH